MTTTHNAEVETMDDTAIIERALADAEVTEILAAETPETTETPNQAKAIADANDADQALAQAAAQADDDDADATSAQTPGAEDVRSFDELIADVTEQMVQDTQARLSAAFSDRAAYEQRQNPANTNIQKTLSKVQRGHLAHGISKTVCAIGLSPDYLNRNEMGDKRRNVYALEKLQDLIYGANTGHVKNAINRAVLASMVRLRDAGVSFTGEVAKACASDKMPVTNDLKALLKRHTVAAATASTQSSSTMTALQDLGAVANLGTRKHPVWTFTDTPLSVRLQSVAQTLA